MKRRNYINEVKDIMRRQPRLTLENVVWEEPDATFSPEEMNSPGFDSGSDMGFEEPLTGRVKVLVDQIRKICISALAQLANDPASPEYDLMKKIWTMCDKTVETRDNKQQSK